MIGATGEDSGKVSQSVGLASHHDHFPHENGLGAQQGGNEGTNVAPRLPAVDIFSMPASAPSACPLASSLGSSCPSIISNDQDGRETLIKESSYVTQQG
jgi:hypothetical protein